MLGFGALGQFALGQGPYQVPLFAELRATETPDIFTGFILGSSAVPTPVDAYVAITISSTEYSYVSIIES